jgi:hypothetical protein
MDEIYIEFEELCRTGNYNEIDNFITMKSIDITYDDNFYVELLAKRGELSLIELIRKHGGDLHYDNETLLCITALYGYTDCMQYIIADCKGDEWKNILFKSNTCKNSDKTRRFLEKKVVDFDKCRRCKLFFCPGCGLIFNF